MKKYFIVPVSEIDSFFGYYPILQTAIGHASNGNTVVCYEEGIEPEGLTNGMTAQEYNDMCALDSGWTPVEIVQSNNEDVLYEEDEWGSP